MDNPYITHDMMVHLDALPVRPLTKLDALRILSNAYWYAYTHDEFAFGDLSATSVIEDKFGYVRRSMTLEDLKPQEHYVTNEGYNGKMPQYF